MSGLLKVLDLFGVWILGTVVNGFVVSARVLGTVINRLRVIVSASL